MGPEPSKSSFELWADESDRRRAVVTLTPNAETAIHEIYGPLGAEGAQVLQAYSHEELRTIHDFLVRARRLQERHADRIRRAGR